MPIASQLEALLETFATIRTSFSVAPENGASQSIKQMFGKRIAKEDAVQGVHRNESQPTWWHAYTEQQIERVSELVKLLIETYPISVIVGHEEIAPGRKTDPGPAFPLDRLRDRWLGVERREDAPAPAPMIATGAVLPPRAVNFAAAAQVSRGGVGRPRTGGNGRPSTGARRAR